MSKLDTTQLEQLRELGGYLHQTREQQSRSLEDVAAKTFIPLRLLRAIEAGQETVLPEPVFIQGFIRRYADVLGLDGPVLAKQFPIDTSPLPAPTEQPDEPPAQLQQSAPPVITETAKPSSRFNPLPVLAILGAVLIGGLAYTVSQYRPQGQTGSTLQQDAPAPSTTSDPIALPTDPAPAQPAATQPDQIEVTVSLTEEAWLRVITDGTVQYEGTLPQGTQRSWTAEEQLTIRAGNAGAVSASLNGGEAQPLGNPGSVATITFPSEAP